MLGLGQHHAVLTEISPTQDTDHLRRRHARRGLIRFLAETTGFFTNHVRSVGSVSHGYCARPCQRFTTSGNHGCKADGFECVDL